MACCCNKIYKLCDIIITCDDAYLVLPVLAPDDGEYTLELDFLDNVVRLTGTFTKNDPLTFETGVLNEHFTYVGHVLDANGNKVNFTVDGIEYDCVEFNTKQYV